VIWYIRPQHAFLESYYLQRVHEGRSPQFAEWLDKPESQAERQVA
jgi:hypothetical protein